MRSSTACSSALVAVSLAVHSLLSYQSDMALAGGVAIHLPQKAGYLHQQGMILSPDGHCRAFDARAQGTVEGDGVGIVVLKRLAEALAERARAFGHRSVEYVGSMENGINAVVEAATDGDLVLTLGAGSVSQAGDRILQGLRGKN